jgi:uncharacterized membrane protein HdeD (DUF308 family)
MGRAIVVNWWALALRGLAGILFAIVAFVWTPVALAFLVALTGAYTIVTGAIALIAGVLGRSWMLGLQGVLGIVAGLVILLWPAIGALAILYLVAFWAILTGLTELGAAFFLRRILRNEWLLVVGGVISILFAVLLLANPTAGLATITWLFGAYALFSGALLLALALRLRGTRAKLVVGPLA